MSTCHCAMKVLVVFDFDNTLVETNGMRHFLKVIPDQMKNHLRDRTMWDLPPMFRRLREKGVKPPDILKCLDDIQLVSGMRDLVLDLARHGHEIIIISDCNSVFIGHTLKKSGLQDCVSRVFTNPSWFDEEGNFRMTEYHHQDWCELCPPNMCKGHILRNYVGQRRSEGDDFLFVAYVGDGQNDYCPALCLSERDLVLPRLDYDLHRTIMNESNSRNYKYRTKAKVVPWQNGSNVRRAIYDELRRYK